LVAEDLSGYGDKAASNLKATGKFYFDSSVGQRYCFGLELALPQTGQIPSLKFRMGMLAFVEAPNQ
jgi:hypothetical protein